jgi:hypothetical protein
MSNTSESEQSVPSESEHNIPKDQGTEISSLQKFQSQKLPKTEPSLSKGKKCQILS